MGALEFILIVGVAWVAIIALLVSFAAVSARADADYDEQLGVAISPTSLTHSPRGLARRGRMPARSGVKLSA